jgi:hypothetical protein
MNKQQFKTAAAVGCSKNTSSIWAEGLVGQHLLQNFIKQQQQQRHQQALNVAVRSSYAC